MIYAAEHCVATAEDSMLSSRWNVDKEMSLEAFVTPAMLAQTKRVATAV